MEVIIQKRFLKELKQFPKQVIASAEAIIDKLKESNSLAETNLDYIKISGQKKGENYYRIRMGSYRMGIELKRPNIIIITIFHRQSDYKNFP